LKKIILGLMIGLSLLSAGKIKFELTPGSINKHLPFKYEDNGQCDQIIERKAYVVCYSYKNKIPLFSAYKLTKESVNGHFKRPNRFFYDNTIPSKYRSKLSHYKRSGFDRGHMMPNASADYTKQAQIETFILSNIVPQNSDLNRNAWAFLEEYIRKLTNIHGTVYVITGAIPSKDNFLKKGHVNIPSKMYKIIYIPSQKRVISLMVPNIKEAKENNILKNYKISLSEIEKESKIYFDLNQIENNKIIKTKEIEESYYEKAKEKAKNIDYKSLYYKAKKFF